MHKIVTGAIAGAAGVALLLGGAGTFALWNASASTAASSVSSGSLTLSANNDGVWTDITNGRSATINPASALMVPGNSYQFTQTLTIGATGQDLKANLTYANQSITGDSALLAATTKTLAVTSSSASVVSRPRPRPRPSRSSSRSPCRRPPPPARAARSTSAPSRSR
jgi:alternate signal-mediated exported protein